jgi:hypothetical protein
VYAYLPVLTTIISLNITYRSVFLGGCALVTLPRTVTPYRNSVDGTRDHVNVSKAGYAVTLRACSVRCQYLAVAWYGYGLSGLVVQSDTSPPSAPLAFFTFVMLLAHVTNWKPHGVTLAGYCYAMRQGMKVQIVTPYRFSHLNVTALRYVVTVQVCTHLLMNTVVSQGYLLGGTSNVRM